ncbi:hypothetical protein IFM89_014752 [Coptis chinensis]|uniref:Homeobox domain-containing protein n=1 Tax=Coptis chinensis TaxID=261450 RepID=A0A835M697_9MAGN|nr:hypothetical protein IFM89_014752 [Coptis chinensis]
MEPQQEPHQQQQSHEENSTGSSSKSSFLCRQSSTRWTPTSDQIRILKDLYYNNGVRSPSAEQIQRISARLRQYGKIEGKNVFYWFQNHKARERQKKRFTVDMAMQRGSGLNGVSWKPAEDSIHTKYSPGSPSSSSSVGVLGVGQMGSNIGYGSVVVEKSFRDCSISPGGSNVGGSINNNFSWVSGVDAYPFFDRSKPIQIFREDSPAQIETLPLFPMHGEDSTGFCSSNPNPFGNWFRSDYDKMGSQTSLELTLNSYTGGSHN